MKKKDANDTTGVRDVISENSANLEQKIRQALKEITNGDR
jgi:hypothetical protein